MKKLSHTEMVMEIATKPGILRNLLVKALVFGVFIICFRFAYVVTIRGESCDVGDFCFFSLPQTFNLISVAVEGGASDVASAVISDTRTVVPFYTSVFNDLIAEGFLSPKSKSLCVETSDARDVLALKELGFSDAVGISVKELKPFVLSYKKARFDDAVFDFVFSAGIEDSRNLTRLADEIQRMLKPEGYLVVHTKTNDTYSFHSFIALFNSCTFVKSREFQGFDASVPYIREIVMKKRHFTPGGFDVNNKTKDKECFVPGYKQEIIRRAEDLIVEEPLKPWITLKRNIQNIKYLSSMVDISFKSRYIYVDVGARSYGSSIRSWFQKKYPKQNKTFEVYAIEADKSFHEEYNAKKKQVTLLPYAAWVRNETLFFEVNHDPGDDPAEKGKKGRGMGRIKPVQSDEEGVDKIQGFDFAEWLKKTVTEKDFVVMKMDVEGTEFDLIPRLFETGTICLIDEIFLECHYNRWQKCCPGERSAKYEKTYDQCLDLFTSLRNRGVLVHQWW